MTNYYNHWCHPMNAFNDDDDCEYDVDYDDEPDLPDDDGELDVEPDSERDA
jgi:hypothetical protein